MSDAADALKYFMMVGKLKDIRRTGWVLRGVPDPERIAGHMYRMAIMAMMLGNSPDAGVDKDKCVKMALVHDLAECIVGDITPTCGVSQEEKFKREASAMKDLGHLVDSVTENEFTGLWQEYEAQETPESQAVKDLDKFDMILQAHEYEVRMEDPGKLQEFFDSTNGKFGHPKVIQWVEELYKLRSDHISTAENGDHR